MHEKKRHPRKYEDTTSSLLERNTSSGTPGFTIQTDKKGNFLRTKARCILIGFQDKQKDYLHTDSPASTRPGFRTSCQIAANKGWDLFHLDLKTVFLQRQSYDVNRDVVCQLPPEAGHPPKIAARLKKLDAPRRWWNILDKALRSYGMLPTRADRFCHVLYSSQSRKQAWEHWIQGAIAQQNGTKDAITESLEQSEMEAAFAKTLDPLAGSPAARKSVAGIINLVVDVLFGTGGNEMAQRVLTRLRTFLQVGSEDWNDAASTGQRIRWTQDSQNAPCIEVSQNKGHW